jgi:hypothetical protein
MTEKKYKYTAKIKQPQRVVNVKLDPKGGLLSEREYKTVKKDVYGASLLEKGLLVFNDSPDTATATDPSKEAEGDAVGETVPDFEAKDTLKDRPEDHAGWRPK